MGLLPKTAGVDHERTRLNATLERWEMSQAQFGDLIGVDKQTVWRWLSAEPKSSNFRPVPPWVMRFVTVHDILLQVNAVVTNKRLAPDSAVKRIDALLEEFRT